MRKLGALGAVLGVVTFAPAAQAAVPSVFDGDAPCAVKADDIRVCQGITETFDGTTPIDVNVILPPEAQGDGPFPAIGWFHGWGGRKQGVDSDGNAQGRARDWALRGYTVFSMSDRDWGMSCGGQDPKRVTPPCLNGYNHLMDTRYEVRDAQFLFGRLADENRVIPDKIGVTGPSYGGGLSMALAALRNRIMTPDGETALWTSEAGKQMSIAVAAPDIPWTDLAYSLMPNGRTLDYAYANNSYLGDDPEIPYPVGVLKQSFVAGLYATGEVSSNYAPPGFDEDADLRQWFALVNAGEPYDENPQTANLVEEITTHHSSYYIPLNDEYGKMAPAPLLISNGWTDDLFPADEAIRFYNRTRGEFGTGSDISLYFLDYGHQRGQNRPTEVAKLQALQETWFDHYLKGIGPRPEQGVTAINQSCGEEEYATSSVGPYSAPTWDELAPYEVRLVSEPAKTIQPAGGSPEDGTAFDPIAGDDACARTNASDKPGTATYRMEPAKGGGFTLAGSPTVIADITSPGPHSQIAARLLDVAPDGEQTLVARGLYRPDPGGRQVFQLHPNGWKFENGHIAKLELLPNDSPYGRPTNGQAPVTVANLDLRLPVRERTAGEPLPSVLPSGQTPAPGTRVAGLCETGMTKKGTPRKDQIKGTEGGDLLQGRRGNDRLNGKAGEDCVAGNKGNDRLRGAKGKDKLHGGKGEDRINSKDGERDRVACGPGKKDRVVADKKDKLTGCERKRR